MIYIAICDDNEKLVKDLHEKIKKILKQMGTLAHVTEYVRSIDLSYDIEEGKYFDLIFSDIEMPDIDGMKLARYIKKFLPKVYIIFITAHIKYAIDAFELQVFRYIPKNSLDIKLRCAVQDVVKMINIQKESLFTIQTPTRIERIAYQDILYIQREGKNSIFFMEDGTEVKIRKSLVQVYDELDQKEFIYVERGSIVNISKIMSIKKNLVELKKGIIIPASFSRVETVKERMNEFWGRKI
ncbi:response regulator transcription factor [Lachnospiraceae bacterium MD308]|nr:response regulator transcription factor [Lachnospiraceae bacterium MD308]